MSFNEIINSNKVVLIDFFATWCGPCKAMPPILKQVKDEIGDGVKIFKVDIDKHPNLAEMYKVQSVPTLMIFYRGLEVWRESGVVSKHDLIIPIENYNRL